MEALLEDAHKLLGNAAQMQRKLEALNVSTRSEDGYVVTTVDARGRLVQVDLDPRIYRSPNAGALGALIVETYQRAVEKIDGDVEKILKEFLPADMDPKRFTKIDFEQFAERRSRHQD
jgi:DNA-binding protein YbaB